MSCASLSRLSAHSPSLFALSSKGLLSSLCVISTHRARSSSVEVPWADAFGTTAAERRFSKRVKIQAECFLCISAAPAGERVRSRGRNSPMAREQRSEERRVGKEWREQRTEE